MGKEDFTELYDSKDIIFYKKFYFNKNGKIDRTRIIMDSRNKINF